MKKAQKILNNISSGGWFSKRKTKCLVVDSLNHDEQAFYEYILEDEEYADVSIKYLSSVHFSSFEKENVFFFIVLVCFL